MNIKKSTMTAYKKMPMKKYIYLLNTLFLLAFTLTTNAQTQIGNADFENFDELGTGEERPTNWNNMMNGDFCGLCSFGATQTTWRDTDTRPGSTGTYSVRVESSSAFGNIVNGNVTLGKLNAPSTTPAEGYNQTNRNDQQFSEVMTDRPDSIVFWAKYSITNNNDSARVSAIIHDDYDLKDPQDGSSTSHILAAAKSNFQTNGNWMRMSFPFDYVGPATTAEYILITYTSSHLPGQGVDGATLRVDDLELIYNDNTLDISPIAVQNIEENEMGTTLTANEKPNAASAVSARQWKFATSSGGPYNDLSGEIGVNYTPQFSSADTYFVVCETNFSGDTLLSNEVEINVDPATNNIVSVSPNSAQYLSAGQTGTTLTASESPVIANSRAWKYSTTMGGSYGTFSTPETNFDYTPVFADTGTYYVVCISDFGNGDLDTSNVVEIVVEGYLGLPNKSADISVYAKNKTVIVDFADIEMNNAKIEIINHTGRIVAQQSLKGSSLNAVPVNVTNGIYYYQLSNGRFMKQGKLFIKGGE